VDLLNPLAHIPDTERHGDTIRYPHEEPVGGGQTDEQAKKDQQGDPGYTESGWRAKNKKGVCELTPFDTS